MFSIELREGSDLEMYRTSDGQIAICCDDSCLVLPDMTANEFMAWAEFFGSLAKNKE